MNPVPSDAADLKVLSGLRFGVSGATTRGFRLPEFETIGDLVAQVLHGLRANGADNSAAEQAVFERVRQSTARFPGYA